MRERFAKQKHEFPTVGSWFRPFHRRIPCSLGFEGIHKYLEVSVLCCTPVQHIMSSMDNEWHSLRLRQIFGL
jgi:hypothetical protein